MALKRQAFTREFKLRVVTEAESGKPMAQIAREHQVNANTVAKWRGAASSVPRHGVRR